jgi:hypothetical protein
MAMEIYQDADQVLENDLNKTKQAEKKRALDEIANLLNKVQTELEESQTKATAMLDQEVVTKQSYSSFSSYNFYRCYRVYRYCRY